MINVWENPGDLLHIMGTQQMMSALQCHSLDEELLMAHIKDIILASGTVAALLAPFTDHPVYPIHGALDALA